MVRRQLMDADAESDDNRRLIFAELDNKPPSNTDMALGQPLAVSDDQIRDHRRFD
jgi:hypothetical protein